MMSRFNPGDLVAVPAAVEQGAFNEEYLVTVSTQTGPVSGFVREHDFVEPKKTIRAVVLESTDRSMTVKLYGSYFTTNGLVKFSDEWAKQNVTLNQTSLNSAPKSFSSPLVLKNQGDSMGLGIADHHQRGGDRSIAEVTSLAGLPLYLDLVHSSGWRR